MITITTHGTYQW